MKIVSLVLVLAALIGTWRLAHSRGPMTQAVHVGIQADLKRIITEYVQTNRPDSKDLRFQKFWTETLKDGKIKATFTYTFQDTTEESGLTELEISGVAVLNKIDENPETVTYSLDELQVLDNSIRFEEPIQITAGLTEGEDPESDGTELEPEEPPAPTEPQPEDAP